MKLKTLVSALLACAVAPFAHAATPTNPSPANFATVDTHTPTMKSFLAKKSSATSYYPDGVFFKYTTTGTAARIALGDDYKTNGIVRLSWKGTSGSSTVKIVRLSDGYTTTLTTTGTSVDFLAPEIGRNYKWTVTNGGNSSTWYFYTDGEAPRIIPQSLCQVGNCRDMGGWVTADGKYRVRQGMGYRNDHNADFYDYSLLKPFWTDIAKIRTDMDLRDKLGSGNYYCLWSLDGNDKHYGRSPYGEHWWNVWYWNVLREGDYGAVMNAYASLVSNRTGSSKKAAVKTWKCFANPQYLPIVVHCSQGRDRTGTVAFVLLGALGVGLNDLYADWALTDYAAPKDFPTGTSGEGNGCIVALYTAIKNAYPDTKYSTLQAKCKQLLTDMGVSDAELTNLKSYLLEPVEEKLTADPSSRTKIGVPSLSATVVAQKSKTVQKPTVKSTSASSTYSVDYGGGGYEAYGKYLVTVNLQNPATTQWSDGTIGPKVLPYIIKHSGNVFQGNVLSFFKGDTNDHIRLAMPRYLGETTCSYTEAQLQKLEPGTYTAKLTAQKCELSPENTNEHSCKFTVYPATENAAYIYEYADLNQAFFKTDYVPAIKTDKIEVRIKDNCTTEGGGYFSCSPYPACLTMFKLSAGKVRYHQGAQRSDIENFTTTNTTIYKYTVATDGTKRKLTVYDESANKSYSTSVTPDSTTPTPGMAYIGCASDPSANRGAEGTPGYHEPHRLYHVKAWSDDGTLIHEFVPCKTTGGYAMLYDKVTKKLYPFSNTMGNTGTVTLGGTATKIGGGDPEPETPDPTAYGAADTAARTYTWKGGNGPWEYTTNWTASATTCYGIPSQGTYATADFPATLTAATACTLTSNRSVLKALFNSPNLTLTIDNATLTVTGLTGDSYYSTYNFGNTATGNPKIIFKGANPRITETKVDYRANFGYAPGGATGNCTVRFEVPAANWSTAPIYTTANESTVCFWSNVRFEIDATALGVPAAGVSKTVPLAYAPGGIRFYDVTLDEILARSTISVASGATGTVAVDGNSLVLTLTSGETPEPTPEPEPTPSSKFDAAHTIICYGDSLTHGENSDEITVDSRANYHDGRLAGVSDVFLSYPYCLSGSVTNYNVINQSRSGSQTCNITSWTGEQPILVKRAFTLPAVGSVSVSTNLVFQDGPYGDWGGWAGTGDTPAKRIDTFNRWAGFVTPILPLMEKYDEAKTRYSITGMLAGRHVRLYGKHPTNITITVFGTGTAQTVAAGSEFVPDNELVSPYKDAIRVVCAGANDGCKNYATAIKPLLVKFRDAGTRYVVMSPWNNTDTGTESNSQTTPTAMEADMASLFGDHYINMRRMLMTNGLATAVRIGQMTAVEAKATTWNTKGAGLMSSDGVHFNKKGNAVIAEFVRQKLVALGYVTGDTPTPTPEPPVVDPTKYGAADTQAATYTWKGGNGPWEYTTNWTASTGATYGIPSQGSYATADFPATLTAATACTLTSNRSVKNAKFNSPNLTFTIDNATLTVTGTETTGYGAYNFGNTATGDPKIVFKGANPGIYETTADWRSNFGCIAGGASGYCTVRFEVPKANWTQAPIRTAATESKVCFWENVKFEIDATALGVPTAGTTVTVPLAASAKGVLFYDADVKNVNFDAVMARSTISVASGATGTVAVEGTSLVLKLTSGETPTPTPTPEPQPSTAFDSDHTIICYGDSLTEAACATNVIYDARPNFHAGRLAGIEDEASYPWVLSGILPQTYNVIKQSRSGAPAHQIMAWSGDSKIVVDRPFTLPAVGTVSIPTNLVFTADCPWGKWGRWPVWAETDPKASKADREEAWNHWAGCVTPTLPLYEPLDETKQTCSFTGWLAGRHVSVRGVWPTETTVTVFGTGTEQVVPAGAEFVPDMVRMPLYSNAVHVVCGSGNDSYTNVASFVERAGSYFDAFARNHKKHIIVSQSCATDDATKGETQLQDTPTLLEQHFAEKYGAHHLNLRMAFVTNGMATAKALGVVSQSSTETWNTALMDKDKTHLTSAGYAVFAEFVRRKLVALGYVESDTPVPPVTPVVDPTKYGAADTKATTYDWKGFSGPWNFTTNWTPSATTCYGIPNNKTYATANFPSNVANAFVCTVTNNMTVNFALFDSPNMTLVLDNASLTCNNRLDMEEWGSFYFGHRLTGDATVELRGGKAALDSSLNAVRACFGALTDGATGVCTVRFVVPATGWESTAPIRAAKSDSRVCFSRNVRFDIDATALGVPAEGTTKTVKLAAATKAVNFWNMGSTDDAENLQILLARSTLVAAAGAKAEVTRSADAHELILTVSPDTKPTADLTLLTPADGAADVAVVRDGQSSFFAKDRDARWTMVDTAADRKAMVETSSFPQDVAFTWQGGTAPYTFTLKRTRDSVVVKTATVSTGAISVCNLETGRAYTWTVTDDAGATLSRTFTTAYADQRFLRVAASNAYETVKGYATKTSADVHNGYLPNFRDFGGMFTADGTKRVKQGVVYRSFCFDRSATNAYTSLGVDLQTVTNALGIKTDLDLRTADEVKNVVAHGASPLGANVAWVHCPTLAYDVDNISSNDEQALRVFMDKAKLPVVFHCLAGQDRTGTLAMQLGAILDLDEEDIEKGWSASCFFQYGMDVYNQSWKVDDGFQTHRVKRFFGDYAKYGQPGDTFAACVRAAIKAKTTLTDADFAVIRANLLETDTEVVRPVKATVDVPDPNAVEREYDGTAQTTYLRTNPRYTVAMANDAVLPGDYPVTLTLVDPSVCAWSDGKTEAKTVTFTITGEGPSVVSPEPVWSGTTVTFTNNTQYTFIGSKSYDATKAVFEPKAKIVATNGATVTIPKVYLQGAGNAFVTEGEGNKIELTPYQAATLAANTSLTFTANGGTITAGKTAAGKNWEFNQVGMTLNCTASDGAYLGLSGVGFSKGVIHAALVDATLKFDSFICATAGSTVALTNATLKTSWDVQMGAAQASLTLAGAAPRLQSASGPLNLGAGLSVTLVPELGWSATDGRIHSMATSSATGAKVTLASGVDFTVDVSAFNGLTTTNTFCLISRDASKTTTHAVTLPDADHVHVVGAGAENCEVTFTASNSFVYVTVAATQPTAGGAVVIDPTTGKQTTVDYDKVGEIAKAGSAVVIPDMTENTLTQDATGAWTLTVGDKTSTFPAYYDVIKNTSYVGGTQYDVSITTDAARNGSSIAADGETPAIQIASDGSFKVNLPNAKDDLYYGLMYADNVQFTGYKISWAQAGTQVSAPTDDTGMFYRVVIDDKPHNVE